MREEIREADGHLVRELHGITLAQILQYLVERIGWERLAADIRINCFAIDPSITSSLKFLRRTAWARAKVEQLYVELRSDELRAEQRR